MQVVGGASASEEGQWWVRRPGGGPTVPHGTAGGGATAGGTTKATDRVMPAPDVTSAEPSGAGRFDDWLTLNGNPVSRAGGIQG